MTAALCAAAELGTAQDWIYLAGAHQHTSSVPLYFHVTACAAAELGRTAQDWIYLAAALEGFASAKVLNAAITNGAFAINQSRWVQSWTGLAALGRAALGRAALGLLVVSSPLACVCCACLWRVGDGACLIKQRGERPLHL